MYGKVFDDIYGSSLMVHGGDTVYVFISMIVLSDSEGFIREHAAAFANRIGKSYDIVNKAIENLEAPDPESSTPDHDGKRIIPLRELTGGQENRGWFVVNKKKYKLLASKEDQREATRERVRKYRKAPVTVSNASVPDGNACNAIQIHIEDRDTDTDTDKTTTGTEPTGSVPIIFIFLPTNKKGLEFPIFLSKVNEWSETYPNVDVPQTMKEIRQWLVDNPTKRKTSGGLHRFINRWLMKEQNNG